MIKHEQIHHIIKTIIYKFYVWLKDLLRVKIVTRVLGFKAVSTAMFYTGVAHHKAR